MNLRLPVRSQEIPTLDYVQNLEPHFGVTAYHKDGILGQNVKVEVIDTGLSAVRSTNPNVVRRMFDKAGSSNEHGAFVSQILSATDPYPGICPKAKVYLNDVDNSKGVIETSELVSALLDAIQLNVDIISISLGMTEEDKSLDETIRLASDKGILVFAASGNCGCRQEEYPAACEDAIAVASINFDRGVSTFNTRNDNVSIFAPGENIIVKTSSGTSKLSGTSFACPFAAGLAALVLSKARMHDQDSSARMKKSTMIQILRNPDHLGLSCSHHNYTRPNGCSVGGLADRDVPEMQDTVFHMQAWASNRSEIAQSASLTVGLLLLAFFVWTLFASERKMTKMHDVQFR